MTSELLKLLKKQLVVKYLAWQQELAKHSRACTYCWSLSEMSTSHRLARMELLH